jgi:hypothetical protein
VRRLRRVRVTLELPYAHVGAVQRLIRSARGRAGRGGVRRGACASVLVVADERLAAVRELAAALALSIQEG